VLPSFEGSVADAPYTAIDFGANRRSRLTGMTPVPGRHSAASSRCAMKCFSTSFAPLMIGSTIASRTYFSSG